MSFSGFRNERKSLSNVWILNLLPPGIGFGTIYAVGPGAVFVLAFFWYWLYTSMSGPYFGQTLVYAYLLMSVWGTLAVVRNNQSYDRRVELNRKRALEAQDGKVNTVDEQAAISSMKDKGSTAGVALTTLELKAREAERRLKEAASGNDGTDEDSDFALTTLEAKAREAERRLRDLRGRADDQAEESVKHKLRLPEPAPVEPGDTVLDSEGEQEERQDVPAASIPLDSNKVAMASQYLISAADDIASGGVEAAEEPPLSLPPDGKDDKPQTEVEPAAPVAPAIAVPQVSLPSMVGDVEPEESTGCSDNEASQGLEEVAGGLPQENVKPVVQPVSVPGDDDTFRPAATHAEEPVDKQEKGVELDDRVEEEVIQSADQQDQRDAVDLVNKMGATIGANPGTTEFEQQFDFSLPSFDSQYGESFDTGNFENQFQFDFSSCETTDAGSKDGSGEADQEVCGRCGSEANSSFSFCLSCGMTLEQS